MCLERSERNDKNYEKITTGIWQRFYFYGGRIPWMKPDKDKIKSLMEGDNLYAGKETNVLDVIIVFSILAMYNLIQTAI